MTDLELILRGLVEPLQVENLGANSYNVHNGTMTLFGVDLIVKSEEIKIIPFTGDGTPLRKFSASDESWIDEIKRLAGR